jgi:CheY-like chemotaxis protein
MTRRILFLDNDTAYLKPYKEVLEDDGYEVEVAESVTRAKELLNTSKFDLLILDVMIPPVSEQELLHYKPQETHLGLTTGLLFYKFNQAELQRIGVNVLVMTIRLDKNIMDDFIKAGLSPTAYVTKYAMSDPIEFLGKIHQILGDSGRNKSTQQ